MIKVVKLRETRDDCSDLAELQALLKQLIGQPFRFFRVSYGDELRLHLGDLQSYSHPEMRGRTKGTYILGARASSWLVSSGVHGTLAMGGDVQGFSGDLRGAPASGHIDIKAMETDPFIVPGSLVRSATADRSNVGFLLQLGFSDSSVVHVLPTPGPYQDLPEEGPKPERLGGMEIADWEILTPHQRILTVGPGPRWSYLDSTTKRGE